MSTKVYYTHENGGRPFKVEILSKNEVLIYKLDLSVDNNPSFESEAELVFEKKPLFKYHPEKIFIGKSPETPSTLALGTAGAEWDGNTNLLQMENGSYVYVGGCIFSFQPIAEITEFVSPMGNNDVPYPWAKDKKGNYYLPIEDTVLLQVPKGTEDPYTWFYENAQRIYSSSKEVVLPRPEFEGIKHWYLGKEKWNIFWSHNPEWSFDALTEDGKVKMSVETTDGKKKKITKEDYVSLNDKFGKELGLESIKKHKFKMLQKSLW
ncbi:MAG TPA: hypothetical protein PKV80_04680 [Leptospiraceae bacterium]|nr:hypothetical protein [Leptospiraceae bacterium]HNI94923.1 hypothetical protein [Leptospiraceae bacterium]